MLFEVTLSTTLDHIIAGVGVWMQVELMVITSGDCWVGMLVSTITPGQASAAPGPGGELMVVGSADLGTGEGRLGSMDTQT